MEKFAFFFLFHWAVEKSKRNERKYCNSTFYFNRSADNSLAITPTSARYLHFKVLVSLTSEYTHNFLAQAMSRVLRNGFWDSRGAHR